MPLGRAIQKGNNSHGQQISWRSAVSRLPAFYDSCPCFITPLPWECAQRCQQELPDLFSSKLVANYLSLVASLGLTGLDYHEYIVPHSHSLGVMFQGQGRLQICTYSHVRIALQSGAVLDSVRVSSLRRKLTLPFISQFQWHWSLSLWSQACCSNH